MLTESLSSVEDLLAVRTPPCQPLLVELLLVRLPVGLRLERLVAECTGKVLGGGGVGDGREARGGGGEAGGGGAVVSKGGVCGGDGGSWVRERASPA